MDNSIIITAIICLTLVAITLIGRDIFDPIEKLTALLAELTKKAVKLQTERDMQAKRADEWYKLYCSKDAEVIELRQEIRRLIEKYEGEKTDGEL